MKQRWVRIVASVFAWSVAAGIVSPGIAAAETVEHGEHIQLYEEMTKMATRTAWKGVEAHYQRLLELEFGGEPLTYEDHMLGAEAARASGDMSACRERLRRAAQAGATPEVEAFLAEIARNYGTISLRLDGRYDGPRALAPATPPFAPDQRANIALVDTYLEAAKAFEGLLAVGEYTIGGTTFTVGAAPVTVLVSPVPEAAPKVATAARAPDAPVASSTAVVERRDGGPLGGVLLGAGAAAAIGGGSLFAVSTSRGWGWHELYMQADAGSAGEAESIAEVEQARRAQRVWGATAGAGVVLMGLGVVVELREGVSAGPVVRDGVTGVEVVVRR